MCVCECVSVCVEGGRWWTGVVCMCVCVCLCVKFFQFLCECVCVCVCADLEVLGFFALVCLGRLRRELTSCRFDLRPCVCVGTGGGEGWVRVGGEGEGWGGTTQYMSEVDTRGSSSGQFPRAL